MGFLSRIQRLARTRTAKVVAAGAAVGVGGSAAIATSDSRPAPEAVELGGSSKEVSFDVEGKQVRAPGDVSVLGDSLDSTAGSADTAGTGSPNTPNTVTPDTPATPDTVTPDTPATPDTPDSPATPDSPPTPDTVTADSPDNSGPGSVNSGPGSSNSRSGSGDDD